MASRTDGGCEASLKKFNDDKRGYWLGSAAALLAVNVSGITNMDKWLIMGSPNIGGLVKGNRKLNAQERSELALERFETVIEKAKEHDAKLVVLGNLLSNEKDFGVLRQLNKLIGEEFTVNLASFDQTRSTQTGLDILADLGRVTLAEKVRQSFKLTGLPWGCALNT